MDAEAHDVATRASWKLSTLLRAKRFFDTDSLVGFYKSQVLLSLEFPTPALYHCEASTLDSLDRVQQRFLRTLGLTAEEALLKYNLAPLQTRRDTALLGLIHRTVLGQGPAHFKKWFFPAEGPTHSYATRHQGEKHSRQLFDYLDGSHTELLRRSALGLTQTYNKLPQSTVDAKSVSTFQKKLQLHVKELAQKKAENWENALNCRKLRQKTKN